LGNFNNRLILINELTQLNKVFTYIRIVKIFKFLLKLKKLLYFYNS